MGIMELADIPECIGPTAEQVDAFKAAVVALFEAYPAKAPPGYCESWLDVGQCRENFFDDIADWHIESSVYDACDTGVPNELIISAYLMIFETGQT